MDRKEHAAGEEEIDPSRVVYMERSNVDNGKSPLSQGGSLAYTGIFNEGCTTRETGVLQGL